MSRLAAFVHRLACGALAGAQLFFAAVAAQQAFPQEVAALPVTDPRRHAAADLVGAMLARLDAATIGFSALAVVCAFAARMRRTAVAMPLLAGLCAVGSSAIVTPAIRVMRIGGTTGLPRFAILHGVSASLLLAEMVCLCVAVWSSRESA